MASNVAGVGNGNNSRKGLQSCEMDVVAFEFQVSNFEQVGLPLPQQLETGKPETRRCRESKLPVAWDRQFTIASWGPRGCGMCDAQMRTIKLNLM